MIKHRPMREVWSKEAVDKRVEELMARDPDDVYEMFDRVNLRLSTCDYVLDSQKEELEFEDWCLGIALTRIANE